MFYDTQPKQLQDDYKQMLTIIGNLSRLFSESNSPYLPYRCHENIFCRYLKAENLARSDCSADSKKDKFGIGLKTWVGNNDQKVAEFGKLKNTYKHLTGIELIKQIAEYRNERIRITKNLYGIDTMIYHIIKRVPFSMQILECSFDYIDIDKISIIKNRGNSNNTYFTDGKHTYHFSTAKNTLYMIFDNMSLLDSFKVEIMSDPYSFLMGLSDNKKEGLKNTKTFEKITQEDKKNSICLRLYSTNHKTGEKFVPIKSGLNQWNASGRKRNPNEVYISYPVEDRNRNKNFFPSRDTPFKLRLPDGSILSVKICQKDGKGIMSNPNKDLGKWLLRKVFELEEGTLITYHMLEIYGIDCVIFKKNGELDYSIDFGESGTYEAYYD